MKLVDDWKDAWTWFSVHVAAFATLLNGLQATMQQIQSLPPELQMMILSPTQMLWINGGLGLAIIWVRLIRQGSTANG